MVGHHRHVSATAPGRSWPIAVVVGAVIADSAVVTIALPDILVRFDVSVAAVSWVLISFNLALALLAVPAAHVALRRPRAAALAGALAFAIGSVLCGLAWTFPLLIAGRVIQAAGGAVVVGLGLEALSTRLGANEEALRRWTVAGVLGAALGPGVGGIVTQVLGWEAIFLLQAPLPLLAIGALRSVTPQRDAPVDRPEIPANAALALLSAGLAAALFLLAVLLINGWRMSPLAAGLALSMMPLAAIGGGRLAPRLGGPLARAVPGAILIAGGLAALGLLPRVGWWWTLAPQALIGLGLGLALSALTEAAMAGRSGALVQSGWTMTARHAGVVVGLVVLTPVFTADLGRNTRAALNAGAAAVLDSPISPGQKIGVAQDVLAVIETSRWSIPDVRPVLRREGADAPVFDALGNRLQDQLDRAATHAFSRSFLIAALLALAALPAVALAARRRRPA